MASLIGIIGGSDGPTAVYYTHAADIFAKKNRLIAITAALAATLTASAIIYLTAKEGK